MSERILSVKELNAYMQQAVRRAAFLQALHVEGELSNFKAYSSGHWYFNLKDAEAAVRCVMFKGYNQAVAFRPENGQQVELTASADFYVKNGEFQLSVKTMLPAGLGQRHLELEQLKEKLSKEGLFAAEHKRALPILPKKIGVVTSPSGAVIRDIIHVLSRRYPNFQLLLAPAQVQGSGAAQTMIAALAELNRREDIDLIIIGRGGGSLEDLWEFNDEALVRAVFASRIPVISAVGHETDFTLCDFVADLRAPTPSAAAELAMPVKADLQFTISELQDKASRALQKKLELSQSRLRALRNATFLRQPLRLLDARRYRLEQVLNRNVMTDPYSILAESRQNLDRLEQSLRNALPGRLGNADQQLQNLKRRLEAQVPLFKLSDKRRLTHAAARLDALSPLRVLARGYALVSDEESGKIISTVNEVRKDKRLRLQMADGQVSTQVLAIIEHKAKEGGPHEA